MRGGLRSTLRSRPLALVADLDAGLMNGSRTGDEV